MIILAYTWWQKPDPSLQVSRQLYEKSVIVIYNTYISLIVPNKLHMNAYTRYTTAFRMQVIATI